MKLFFDVNSVAFDGFGRFRMKFAYLGLGVALLLFGCNLFDPSDDVSVDTSDASMMTYEGQNCFRNSEYANAANFFKQAIQKDSTLSEAWLGLSKANLYLYAGNPYNLIHELYADTDIPLMNLDSSEVAKYFKAVNSSLIPLRELIRRDTLTEQDPSLKLSDRSVTYSNFSASHAILELAYTILRFRYTNSSFIKISINEDRSLSFDLQALYDQALLDPAVLAQFNASVDSLKGDLTQLFDAVLPAASSSLSNSDLFEIDDSTGKAQILGDDLQSDAETVEKSVSFYKLGDGIDNDGDGCVDEEILDGYDNDGDGYVDEDLRLVPLEVTDTETIVGVGVDSLDHDMNGLKEDKGERILLSNNRFYFAKDFEQLDLDDTSMVNLRHAISLDTDSTHIQYPLKTRQLRIGRCWNNYTQETFKEWFRNR